LISCDSVSIRYTAVSVVINSNFYTRPENSLSYIVFKIIFLALSKGLVNPIFINPQNLFLKYYSVDIIWMALSTERGGYLISDLMVSKGLSG